MEHLKTICVTNAFEIQDITWYFLLLGILLVAASGADLGRSMLLILGCWFWVGYLTLEGTVSVVNMILCIVCTLAFIIDRLCNRNK